MILHGVEGPWEELGSPSGAGTGGENMGLDFGEKWVCLLFQRPRCCATQKHVDRKKCSISRDPGFVLYCPLEFPKTSQSLEDALCLTAGLGSSCLQLSPLPGQVL